MIHPLTKQNSVKNWKNQGEFCQNSILYPRIQTPLHILMHDIHFDHTKCCLELKKPSRILSEFYSVWQNLNFIKDTNPWYTIWSNKILLRIEKTKQNFVRILFCTTEFKLQYTDKCMIDPLVKQDSAKN